jgi:hypothetical protein
VHRSISNAGSVFASKRFPARNASTVHDTRLPSMSRILREHQQENLQTVEKEASKLDDVSEELLSDSALIRALSLGQGEWKRVPLAVRQHLRHVFSRVSRLENQVLPSNWEEVFTCLPLQERVRACEQRIRSLERKQAAQQRQPSGAGPETVTHQDSKTQFESLHEAVLNLACKTAASVRSLDTRLRHLEQARRSTSSGANQEHVAEHNEQSIAEIAQSLAALQQQVKELQENAGNLLRSGYNESTPSAAVEPSPLFAVTRLDKTIGSLQAQLSGLLQDQRRQENSTEKPSMASGIDWQTRIPEIVREQLRAAGLVEPLETTVERCVARAVQALRDEMRQCLVDKVDRDALDARLVNRPSKASVLQAFQKLRDTMRSEMGALEDRLLQRMRREPGIAAELEQCRVELKRIEAQCHERGERLERDLLDMHQRLEPLEARMSANNREYSSFLLSLRTPPSQGDAREGTAPAVEAAVQAPAHEADADCQAAPSAQTESVVSEAGKHLVRPTSACHEQGEQPAFSDEMDALCRELEALQRQLMQLTHREGITPVSNAATGHQVAAEVHTVTRSPSREHTSGHYANLETEKAADIRPAKAHESDSQESDSGDPRHDGCRQGAPMPPPGDAAQLPLADARSRTEAFERTGRHRAALSANALPNTPYSKRRVKRSPAAPASDAGRTTPPALTKTPQPKTRHATKHEPEGSLSAPPLPSKLAFGEDAPAQALDTSTPSAATWYHRRASLANSASKQCEELERSVLLADPDETLNQAEAVHVLHSIDKFLSEWRTALQERTWARSIEDENSRAIGLALAEVRGYLNAEMCAERGLREAAQRLFALAHSIEERMHHERAA